MSEFQLYFQLGFEHILDLEGYDHILFIVALCAIYKVAQWKNILLLVTAFTIGHSVSLTLASLKIMQFSAEVVEFLIPLTILLTALYNVFKAKQDQQRSLMNSFYALCFGLIHGLGFSNYLSMLIGMEEEVLNPLLAFSIGVELGLIVIVLVVMLVGFLVMNVFGAKQRDWILFISGAAAGIALILILGSDLIANWTPAAGTPASTFE
ncbi:MAG: HupE/UreJ family protein [Bacteroidota bacterium]